MRAKKGGNTNSLGEGSFGRIVTLGRLRKDFATQPIFYDSHMQEIVASKIDPSQIVLKVYKTMGASYDKNKVGNFGAFLIFLEQQIKDIDREEVDCFVRNIVNTSTDCSDPKNNEIMECLKEIAQNVVVHDALGEKSPIYENIVFATFVDGPDTWIFPTYERYDGDVQSLLKTLKSADEMTKSREFANIAKVLLQSVCMLHERKLYHFDIKLVNLLYKKTGDTYVYVLSDYGLLSTVNTKNPSKGTPPFMSLVSTIPYFYNDYCPIVLGKLNASVCNSVVTSYDDADKPGLLTIKDKMEGILFDSQNCDDICADSKFMASLETLLGKNFDCDQCKQSATNVVELLFEKNDLYAVGVSLTQLTNELKVVLPTTYATLIEKLVYGNLDGTSIFKSADAWNFFTKSGGSNKYKYRGKKYAIRTGTRGGKFILYNSKKIYV